MVSTFTLTLTPDQAVIVAGVAQDMQVDMGTALDRLLTIGGTVYGLHSAVHGVVKPVVIPGITPPPVLTATYPPVEDYWGVD